MGRRPASGCSARGEIGAAPTYLYHMCAARPGATRAPRNLTAYASWRALSGHTARETMYYNM
eukprot:4673411-Pyramimonas_sp.AAC.1